VRQPDGWHFRKGVYRKLRLRLTPLSDNSRTPRLRSSVMKHWPEW
jgi:hypothetical protein